MRFLFSAYDITYMIVHGNRVSRNFSAEMRLCRYRTGGSRSRLSAIHTGNGCAPAGRAELLTDVLAQVGATGRARLLCSRRCTRWTADAEHPAAYGPPRQMRLI